MTDEITHRLASLIVRVQCNQHKDSCTGRTAKECSDPDHRIDAGYLKHCLAMLGLDSAAPDIQESDRLTLLKNLKQIGTRPDISDLMPERDGTLTRGN